MLPGDAVVAARAVAAELALVGFLFAMTGVAIGRRFAEALAARMAAVARDDVMRTLQRKVSAGVIELVATELDDVGIPPEMLGMTGMALK